MVMMRLHAFVFLQCVLAAPVAAVTLHETDAVSVNSQGDVVNNRKKRLVRRREEREEEKKHAGEEQETQFEILADGTVGNNMEDAMFARQANQQSGKRRYKHNMTSLSAHRQAVEAHMKKLFTDTEMVIKVIEMGLNAILESVPHFIAKPPKIAEACQVYQVELWKIIELVVPAERKADPEFANGKDEWDTAFSNAMNLADKVNEFQTTGDTTPLALAIIDIVDQALRVAAATWPKSQEVFDAVRAVILGIGEAWECFEDGEWPLGVSKIWNATKEAVDDLVPEHIQSTETYQYVMTTLQITIGDLHKHVYEFKRRIMESRVCYKAPTYTRKEIEYNRGRPDQCEEGWEYDQFHSCLPSRDMGRPCMQACGVAGFCDHECGMNKACCRKAWGEDPCECEHASGYVYNQATGSSITEYWQCVTPGPCRVVGGKCQNHESLLETNSSGFRRERQLDMALERKKKDKKEPAEDRSSCVAPVRPTLIESKLGLDKLPGALIESDSSSEDQVGDLDKVVRRKDDKKSQSEPVTGAVQATCKEGELIGARCYEECGMTYKQGNSGTRWCKMDCEATGTHPYTGPVMFCGIDPEAITTTWSQMLSMVMQTAMSAAQLGNQIKDEGFDAEKLKTLTDIVVEMAAEFAKPRCNASKEIAAEMAQTKTRDTSKIYDDAINVFRHFDTNFDGHIDKSEITKKVSVFGRKIELDAGVMTDIDSNRDGMVQFNEFVEFLRKRDILSIPKLLPNAGSGDR